jgi:4-aminobutyrate aminotransferase-like enzyme/Ser/Thr protein kinase RdoA (MazF antagonist)
MDITQLTEILTTHFALDVDHCRVLPGEVDLNAFVSTADGTRYVLKLYAADTSNDGLELQDAALARLATIAPGLIVPALVLRTSVDIDGASHVARMLSWVDGRPLADIEPSSTLLRAIGRAVARTDQALGDVEHSALDRRYRWNMMQCNDLPTSSNVWATQTLRAFCNDTLPVLRLLPQQAIHNDANDDNVVIAEDDAVALIDFGDIVRSPRIVGLGVAVAYAMLRQLDPLAAAAAVVGGYHEASPLHPEELAVLDATVRARLAMSITIAELQVAEHPDNADYLSTSQDAIAHLVDIFQTIPAAEMHATYRHACGYLPVAAQRDIQKFFGSANFNPAPIVDAELSDAQIIDWSSGADRQQHIAEGRPALGRYAERRTIYDTPAFGTPFGERRTLHLGIDIFVPAGTPGRSPLDGVVHSCDIRDEPGDYGGVVIIEYRTSDGTPFWMLVGHLDHASIGALKPGNHIERGGVFAHVGARDENGGWTPHLHVQLYTDLLGQSTELDGVARASQRDVWTSISPNPSPLIVGVDSHSVAAPRERDAASIRERRRANLSPSLSLSYDEPLHIVQGDGASLVDARGRRWLDLVNNVAHVGHEHPHVVDAITAQARTLNTNTRYLHRNIVDYAERLSGLFPDPLSVVFLTNSGSEAVDLALRLARTATGRQGVLTLDWGYHGNLTSLIEISPYKFNRAGGTGPSERVRICELPDPYRGVHGTDGAAYADDVARQATHLARAGFAPAAFVHESISGCGGQVDLAPGYLEAAYAHAQSAGALCISDEVQCGLGRVGTDWWAFETHGVVPDIVTMGKPLGNGHPLGAVITTPHVARAFANGMEYFNTFGGNPVSCAAGLAVLDVMDDERLRAHATNVGDHLVARLRELAERHPTIGDVRGRGLFVGVELVDDPDSRAPATALTSRVIEGVRRRGILVSSDGPHANVLKIKPPLVVTAAELDHFVDALDATVGEPSNTWPGA